jgi:hypothetical protein
MAGLRFNKAQATNCCLHAKKQEFFGSFFQKRTAFFATLPASRPIAA